MKRFVTSILLAFAATVAFAQTPEEIVEKMNEVTEAHNSEGLILTLSMKIPIIGTTSTRVWTLGEKSRMEIVVEGHPVTTWIDNSGNSWVYDEKENKVTIDKVKLSQTTNSASDNMGKFSNTEGYDLSIENETDDAWHILCTKSKTNKHKDDPKNMNIVVAKGSYLPVSLGAKVSGIEITLKDIAFGVTPEQVSFNINDYPDATIEDKRK